MTIFKPRLVPVTILMTLILTGCNGANTKGDLSGLNKKYDGIWVAPAYGYAMQIIQDEGAMYSFTQDYCYLDSQLSDVSYTGIEQIVNIELSNQSITLYPQPGLPGIRFDKELHLPSSCTNNLVASSGADGYKTDPIRDIDMFWQTFNELYVDFDLTKTDWEQIRQYGLANIRADSDTQDTFEILLNMITPLADGHVQLSSDTLGYDNVSFSSKPGLEEHILQDFLQVHDLQLPLTATELLALYQFEEASLVYHLSLPFQYAAGADVKTAANDQIAWVAQNEIGYLFIGALSDFVEDDDNIDNQLKALELALDNILDDFRHVQGVIIDIRLNGGGSDSASVKIANRFVDHKRHIFSKQTRLGGGRTPLQKVYAEPEGAFQFTGPVAVLTSSETASAAEILAMSMASMPNVTLIGQASYGIFSDTLVKSLPSGIEYSLSNEFYLSTEGEWFERKGVPVDIDIPFYVPFDERELGRDLALETAKAQLK